MEPPPGFDLNTEQKEVKEMIERLNNPAKLGNMGSFPEKYNEIYESICGLLYDFINNQDREGKFRDIIQELCGTKENFSVYITETLFLGISKYSILGILALYDYNLVFDYLNPNTSDYLGWKKTMCPDDEKILINSIKFVFNNEQKTISDLDFLKALQGTIQTRLPASSPSRWSWSMLRRSKGGKYSKKKRNRNRSNKKRKGKKKRSKRRTTMNN